LNLRPHPYQQNAGNRCANRRSPRSHSTVVGEVMCSHRVQLCALILPLIAGVGAPYGALYLDTHVVRLQPAISAGPCHMVIRPCSRSRSSSGMLRTVARGSFPSVYPRACPTAPSVTASAHLGRCPLRTSCERPTRGGRVGHALAGCCRWIRWVQTWGTRVATWLGTPAGPGRRC
jgi:hypothetical protein